jgi:lysozyme
MVFGETNRMYEEIKSAIIKHEGKVNKVYKDHLGNATFGVGHLVLPSDDLQEGIEYDDTKIMEFFERDFDQAVKDARSFTKEENIDPVAFGCVINMAFQLGLPRLLKFKNFQYHLNKCEYESASSEMLDSRWAKQTPNRANELAETMRNI